MATFTFWNPGFMILNLKIIFQNCWHNNFTNPILCQFTVNMYHQLTDPFQHPIVDIMFEGLPTEKTWMLKQRKTSKLNYFLQIRQCTLWCFQTPPFIVSVVLCLPSILQYEIRSKRIIVTEVLECIEIFPLVSLIFFGALTSKNSHKMECRILENSVQS